MAFELRMGLPTMDAIWSDLTSRKRAGSLGKDEQKLFKKLIHTFALLQENPRHNSLASHEIEELTRRHGFKVFQSYIENNTPSAGRVFWTYGPEKGNITILAIEPHPEDQKRGAYDRVKLSDLPPLVPKPHGKK